MHAQLFIFSNYNYHHQIQTLVDDWFSIPEEGNGRESLNSIFLSQPCLLSGDKMHPMVISVVINVLEFIQDLVALLALLTAPA